MSFLSKLFKKEKEPVRLDAEEQYLDFSISVQEMFPDDICKQVEYASKNAPSRKIYLLFLLQQLQHEYSMPSNKDIEITYSGYGLDFFFRGYLDAVRHMQPGISDGVFDYVTNKSESFLLECLEPLKKRRTKV